MHFKDILCAVLLACCGISGFAQNEVNWTPAVAIADRTYGNLRPRMALDKQHRPMIIWGEQHGRLYFSKLDGNWLTEPIKLNLPAVKVYTEQWAGPELATRGDTVYVIYKQTPEDVNGIFVRHSYDGGRHFSTPAQVDDNIKPCRSRFPAIAIDDDGNPVAAYMKFDSGYSNPRYVVARSADLGETFMPDTAASGLSGGLPADCCPGSMAVSGEKCAMVYRENRGGLMNIWAGISVDTGNSFTYARQADTSNWVDNICPASAPQAILNDDTLYSVFMSAGTGTALAYFSRTGITDLFTDEQPVTGNFYGLAAQSNPRLSVWGRLGAVAWQQGRGTSNELCVSFTRNIAAGFRSGYDTIATGLIGNADIALYKDTIYAVWQDDLTGQVMTRIGYVNNELKGYTKQAPGYLIKLMYDPYKKLFTVKLPGLLTCELTDKSGSTFYLDVECANELCTINTEEMEPGHYNVRLMATDAKVYNSTLDVK